MFVQSAAMNRLLAPALKGSFITAKINARDTRALTVLRKAGFTRILDEVTLESGGKAAQIRGAGKLTVRRLVKNTGLPYKELGSSFSLTRFHRDPHISRRQADGVWIVSFNSPLGSS